MKDTIFFGNGLNYSSKNNITWISLLDKIKGRVKFDNGELPNTFIYERALFENISSNDIRESESNIKNEIAKLLSRIDTNDLYKMLFGLGCKNYLTTNYDYAFKKLFFKSDSFLVYNHSTEDIYSIRRQTQVFDKRQNELCKIWNIHGELDSPISIMLGLDHYCGSVSKLDSYVKGTYEFQENLKLIRIKKMTDKLNLNEFDNRSWVELFFNSNIHILGLTLDYSETDIWWILTKRARMMKEEKIKSMIKNKVFFYDRYIKIDKEKLLESLHVTVVKPKLDNYNDNWNQYYYDTIDKINSKIK